MDNVMKKIYRSWDAPLEFYRMAFSFCIIMPAHVPLTPWGIRLRDLMGKRFINLHTAHISPHTTFTFLGELKKDIRGYCLASVGDLGLAKDLVLWTAHKCSENEIDRFASELDKCINSFGGFFWGKKCFSIVFLIWPTFISLSLMLKWSLQWFMLENILISWRIRIVWDWAYLKYVMV